MADEDTGADNVEQTGDITYAMTRKDYPEVIALVREAVREDPQAALNDPVINEWMGRRYRNIFITEALANPDALKNSQAPFPINLVDPRSDREKVAKRMISNVSDQEIFEELPPAEPSGFANTTLVFAPGLLTGLLPNLAFQSVWPGVMNRFRVKIAIADSHPMRGTEANVADLENVIERGIGVSPIDASFITEDQNPSAPGDVILMGYSKGAPDILTLLARRPDLAPRIRAVIGWAGAVGGSYLANDIYKQIKDLPAFDTVQALSGDIGKLMLRLAPVIQINNVNRRLDEYDIKGAIQSLTTDYREQFLEENGAAIDDLGIPMFNFTGSTHLMEVPYYQRQGTLQLLKYDKYNDMQLTQDQAHLPATNAPLLSMFHANHWDLSYDTFPWYTTLGSTKLKDPFAREAAMSSILLFMSEIGLMD
ncbi:MAG: hypothetical protein H6525_01985 [Actinobacteria bacterium]|nr:hypothetical protein [Actinomycetota bacterium]